MQGRNRDTDVENRHVDTEREVEGGTNRRLGLTYIHYYV